MKRVNYEFYDSEAIIPLSRGIGMQPDVYGPIAGDLIGIISLEDEDYLIARTTTAFKDDPKYLDKIMVRRAFADVRNNNVCIDREPSDTCIKMEQLFNSGSISANPINENPNEQYDKVTEAENVSVIAVNHDYFEKQKMLIETGKIYPEQRPIKNY